ncbi:SDR family NAD(P)-dependent oxidoreductase [Microbacterium sulfonylureivorans]|uniref:SDR family NAD(P)-dependent oxidoreductase n=1 Tax=Microbacterium sulfonylureivorans TaxID=2486854 RepID=UPI000FDCAE46|nr:SDR family NAD(P)-dependent oxidoreductase [Microbacterium sulfonylureivorans]
MSEFMGRGAVVTGAGSGIGAATAADLAERGAKVALIDVDLDAAQRHAAEIGRGAIALQADVRDSFAMKQAIDAAAAKLGRLDHLVGSAGVVRYGQVVDLDEADWDLQIDVNLKGAYLLAKYGIPHLRASGGGSIAFVASVQAFASQPAVAAYAASKGGLVALTKAIALDHAGEGIRCNAVCPGSVDTSMLRDAAELFGGDGGGDEVVAAWGRGHPLGFVAQGSDVAEAIAFLLGDHTRFITGAALPVDGGLLTKLAL